MVRTGSSVTGSRPTATPYARHLGGHLGQPCPLAEPVGAVEVGGQVHVAEPEPRPTGGGAGQAERRRTVQGLHHVPRLAGQPHPRSGSMAPASVYVIVSRSGLMLSPWSTVVPVDDG